MSRAAVILLFIPLMLFGYSFEDAMKSVDIQNIDSLGFIKTTWVELGMPTSADTKEDFQERVMQWWSNKENQEKFIAKLQAQAAEGGLSSSPEVTKMIAKLRESFKKFDEKKKHEEPTSCGYITSCVKCSLSQDMDRDILDRIEELREQEREHKDEAFDLMLQAGGEAMAAGVSLMSGAEPLALYEGYQSTRHIVQGCEEYNEGVRYQQEADALEAQYSPKVETDKAWWEVWK